MAKAERVAVVCPRLARGATVGGAETLLRELALQVAGSGRRVTFLATCATDHFTWQNVLPAGRSHWRGLEVLLFPVSEERDSDVFLRAQRAICQGGTVHAADAEAWLGNGCVSPALVNHLQEHHADYDCILAGPYLFSVVVEACRVCPQKTFLVPCLHDEPFARIDAIREMFQSVRGVLFNAIPEQELADALYGSVAPSTVVGMGLAAFKADGARFRRKHDLRDPYILYCGRREELKGTPLLLDYFAAFCARTGRTLDLALTGSGPIEVPQAVAANVRDFGFVSEEDKRDAMAGAVAFCHPSLYESFGIVLLEAWMAGTPALVHARSSVLKQHCKQAQAGLWFRSYPDFEEGLLLLLDQPELADQLGQNGKAYVEREYSWERIAGRLFEAIDG